MRRGTLPSSPCLPFLPPTSSQVPRATGGTPSHFLTPQLAPQVCFYLFRGCFPMGVSITMEERLPRTLALSTPDLQLAAKGYFLLRIRSSLCYIHLDVLHSRTGSSNGTNTNCRTTKANKTCWLERCSEAALLLKKLCKKIKEAENQGAESRGKSVSS